MNDYDFLNDLVSRVRESIGDPSMSLKCDAAQSLIGHYLDEKGIFYTAGDTLFSIGSSAIGHRYIICFLDSKAYLVDPTYIQFQNIGREVYAKGIRVCSYSPYYYFHQMDSKMADSLLMNGYLPFDERVAYLYGNSFVLSQDNIKEGESVSLLKEDTLYQNFLRTRVPLVETSYPPLTNLRR